MAASRRAYRTDESNRLLPSRTTCTPQGTVGLPPHGARRKRSCAPSADVMHSVELLKSTTTDNEK